MSTQRFELTAEIRQVVGKGASRRLRHSKQVPAIIYGGGEEPALLTLNHNQVTHALQNEAFYSHILTLNINDRSEKVILKAMQRDPAKPRILHMDFLRVKADQELHMHIPLHFIGEDKAPGAKVGGVFSHLMNDVEIICLPANLPEFIAVDVSAMELDQTIHLTELTLPQGVKLAALSHGVEGHDLPVISIHMPRITVEETTAVTSDESSESTGEEDTKAAGAADKEKKA